MSVCHDDNTCGLPLTTTLALLMQSEMPELLEVSVCERVCSCERRDFVIVIV
eukprot:m.170955 g.170955  ORF g.170955 m.170955 type:complete len:52 (-) comp14542_c0_seq1:1865-2020(-)